MFLRYYYFQNFEKSSILTFRILESFLKFKPNLRHYVATNYQLAPTEPQ